MARWRIAAMLLIVAALAFALLVRWGLIGGSETAGGRTDRARPFRLSAIGEPDRTVALQELRGKGVLITFWATWCEPCIEEMPLLKSLHERYHGLHFQVLGVTDDDLKVVEGWLAENPLPWTNLHDSDGSLRRRFGAEVLPFNVYLGPDGKVDGAVAGKLREDDAREAVERLVARSRAFERRPANAP